MGQAAAPTLANFYCHTPCAAVLPYTAADRSFNVSVLVHAAVLDQVQGPGLIPVIRQWPSIALGVDETVKETGPGKWSKEKCQWEFRESLTLRAGAHQEVSIRVSSSSSYNLMVGSTALEPRQVAERHFTVAEVLPNMRVEDRKGEGHVYTTPVIPFDVFRMGAGSGADHAAVGRLFLSFETKTGWAAFHREDESLPTLFDSDAQCEAAVLKDQAGICTSPMH